MREAREREAAENERIALSGLAIHRNARNDPAKGARELIEFGYVERAKRGEPLFQKHTTEWLKIPRLAVESEEYKKNLATEFERRLYT